MKRITTLLLLIASITTQNTFAYNDSIPHVNQVIEDITIKRFNPLEKVYLHMDNTSYFMNDTLWFKAYVINTIHNRPTQESEILHVELLNPEGVIVRTQKYRLKGGTCDGSIVLDKELLSGFFEVRAYTKAMLNFDDYNYFTRVFPVFDGTQQSPEILNRQRTVGYIAEKLSKKEVKLAAKESKQAAKESENQLDYTVEFYPEGGNLIDGLTSKVAFQIRDNYGRPIATKCEIIDDDGNTINSESTHLGIGAFEITSTKKSGYMLIEGDKTKYDLPKPLSSGSVVSVKGVTSGVEIAVSSNMSEALELAIVSQGAILIEKECKNGDNFTIDNRDLREGVNQAVIYNNQGKAVASRLFFVKNGTQPQLTIMSTKSGESTPHARQDLTFKVADSSGNGIATGFSLSIYDDATSVGTPQQNIYTSLLLSSELRGYIPNADYYFEANDAERTHNLDLIMMVHGWSRYKWDEMSGYTSKEIIFPYENRILVYGRVFSQKWNTMIYSPPQGVGKSDYDLSRYDRSMDYPAKGAVPDDGSFVLSHATIIDDQNVNLTFDDNISYKKNNRFWILYPDFNDDLKVLLKHSRGELEGHSDKSYYKSSRNFFILDSEYRPDERLYDFSEQLVGQNITLKEMSNSPSVTIKYWNNGRFSDLYRNAYKYLFGDDNRHATTKAIWLFDPMINHTYTSLERFNEYYLNKKFLKKTDYNTDYFAMINNTYTSANKQLYFRKMPYGTVSYLSTMIDVRTPEDSLKGYVTIPLEGEFPDAKWLINPSVMYWSPKRYEYVIDSTIIHTSLDKRMELYNRYKDHEDYKTMLISDWLFPPELNSSKSCPDYIIEHFGRTIDTVYYSQQPYDNYNVTADYITQYALQNHVFILQGLEGCDREFYSPDYSTMTPPASGDHRRTLYWNPNVRSNSQGNATVTFYNNSKGGSYTIDAQTITSDGQIGTTTATP